MTESSHPSFNTATNQSLGHASVWLDLFERQPLPDSEELAWAAALTEKLQQNQPADQIDLERLQAITSAFFASRRDLPAPNLQELSWVQELTQRDQPPDQAEEARLWDICARFLLEQEALLEAEFSHLAATQGPPSHTDREWAREQISASLKGIPPNQADYQRFMRILKACRDFKQKL